MTGCGDTEIIFLVRKRGLEPLSLSALAPKSKTMGIRGYPRVACR
jgi:hypothetical protein